MAVGFGVQSLRLMVEDLSLGALGLGSQKV